MDGLVCGNALLWSEVRLLSRPWLALDINALIWHALMCHDRFRPIHRAIGGRVQYGIISFSSLSTL